MLLGHEPTFIYETSDIRYSAIRLFQPLAYLTKFTC